MDNAKNSKYFSCECTSCNRYSNQYNSIMLSNPMWLTVSPPPSDKDPSKEYREWLIEFMDLLKCTDSLIGVVEFANMRMHFHIMYNCIDKIKSYRLVNGLRQANQIKIYKGGPKEGLHYLFKDINESKELILHMDTVFTHETLKDIKLELKSKLIKEYKEYITKDIPQCFLANRPGKQKEENDLGVYD